MRWLSLSNATPLYNVGRIACFAAVKVTVAGLS